MMPKILDLNTFIEKYSYIENNAYLIKKLHITLRHAKITIFSLYLICWLYILCVSFHTLNGFPITIKTITWIIINVMDIIEPFAGTLL